jgi:DNA-binding transcriptional regulator YhcF (GntR family)
VEIFLNRRGGVPVRDQLVAQLEMEILSGNLVPGARLPSVRALARRLELHPNTVSAAYQDLTAAGHVERRPGAGVFVRQGAPVALPEARGLDEMIRLALLAAREKGYTGAEIRAAVERWLRASPPERVLVIDRSAAMADLVAQEVRPLLPIPVSGCSLEHLVRRPERVAGALVLTLAYHAATVARLAPGAAVEVLHLEFSAGEREAVRRLSPGSAILVVSHSPTLLPFASVLLRSLRGDDVLVEAQLLKSHQEWRRLLPASDLVFADAVSAPAVRKARPRRLREFRVVSQDVLGRLKDLLTVVVPRGEGRRR